MQKGMKAGTEMGAHGTVIHECQKKKKKGNGLHVNNSSLAKFPSNHKPSINWHLM